MLAFFLATVFFSVSEQMATVQSQSSENKKKRQTISEK
jgi:hypothetical protein